MKTKQLRKQVSVWGDWIAEGKILGIAVLAILIAVIISFWCGTIQSFNLMGFWLQFSGILLAINGLCEIPLHFGLSSPWEKIIEWWKKRPGATREVSLNGSFSIGSDIDITMSYGEWIEPDQEFSVNKQLSILNNNVNLLKKTQDHHQDEIHHAVKEHARLKQQVNSELEHLSSEIQEKRKDLHTNGWGWSLVGLIWILSGTLLVILGPIFN